MLPGGRRRSGEAMAPTSLHIAGLQHRAYFEHAQQGKEGHGSAPGSAVSFLLFQGFGGAWTFVGSRERSSWR